MKNSFNKQITLLVVDDEPATRYMLLQSLKEIAHTLIEAEDGRHAIDKVKVHSPDFILMDVQMPELDGVTVCQMLRDAGNSVPIILMTSNEDSAVIDSAFTAGATDFITKPISWALLAQRIRYALRNEALKLTIRESQLELDKAQSIAKMGHWSLDISSMTWSFSKNVRGLYNLAGDESNKLGYQEFFDLIDNEYANELKRLIEISCEKFGEYRYDFPWTYNAGDNKKHIAFHWQVVTDDNDKCISLHGVSQDITERKHAEATIEHQAYYDHLTNLPNRRLFSERLMRDIHFSDRENTLVAVLFIDCDRFKPINDSLGHQVGDSLLISIADRLQSCVRTNDTVCRVSGDEFAVLLVNLKHVNEIDRVANNIVKSISSPHQIANHKVFTSVSIGVAVYPFDENVDNNLLSLADVAMYHAKQKGGNQYQYYSSEMNMESTKRMHLEQDLHEALVNQEMQIYYQPQNCIDDGRLMIGVESLLRWNHPEHGLISPLDFIPIAEESGLIIPIGEWVVFTACKQAVVWKKQGYGEIRIGINLSPRQFNQANLITVVEQAIVESGINPAQLDMEITESISMQNMKSTIDTLGALKELGVNISLDDFGTGYSSLSYLQKMPIDTLKIDRAFIRNLHESKKDYAFVKTIITMAHSLGMEVVAEGVENEEQFQLLKDMKCEVAQGYMFSKPVPADQLMSFLKPLKNA